MAGPSAPGVEKPTPYAQDDLRSVSGYTSDLVEPLEMFYDSESGQAMKTSGGETSQHAVNLGVLLFSAAAAWVAPLETFIVAYAVIGPFHYLTEMAWLRKKQFFFGDGVVSPRVYLITASVLCIFASLDLYFKRGWAVYAIGLLIVLSLGAMVKNVPVLMGALALVFATKFFVHGYGLFVAAFVPTVVHVYFFTLIFLISGAMRGRRMSVLGWVNPLLLLVIPLVMIRLSARFGVHTPGAYWMSSEASFADVHEYISGLMGLGMHFNAGGTLAPNAVATFRFLAFIYLHHYLNWFAKTELLAWHKVSRRSWVAIVTIYAAMIGSYAYNFAVGFYASYFVSLLHVLLELPLNWRGGVGIVAQPWSAWRARRAAEVLVP